MGPYMHIHLCIWNILKWFALKNVVAFIGQNQTLTEGRPFRDSFALADERVRPCGFVSSMCCGSKPLISHPLCLHRHAAIRVYVKSTHVNTRSDRTDLAQVDRTTPVTSTFLRWPLEGSQSIPALGRLRVWEVMKGAVPGTAVWFVVTVLTAVGFVRSLYDNENDYWITWGFGRGEGIERAWVW